MKTYDLNKCKHIKPESFVEFLSIQGWSEAGVMPGVVSVWELEKNGEIHKILLPLNPESPDYSNRVNHALEVISQVESREKSNLIETLLDRSLLAEEEDRELVDLRLVPDTENEDHRFPVKQLGAILYSFQNLVDSIGSAESGFISPSVGKMPKLVTDETKLFVVGTAPGSFVVKMAGETHPAQGNWIDLEYGSLEQKALRSFLELIKVSCEGDLDALKEILNRLQRRTVVSYKKFLGNISSADSGFSMSVGSKRSDVNGSAHLDRIKILGLITILKEIEPQVPEIIQVDGILKLAGESSSKGTPSFRIQRLHDGEMFYGKIASSALQKAELTIDRAYRAIIEETESINQVTNETSKNWVLVDIDYLERARAEEEGSANVDIFDSDVDVPS